MHRKTKKIALSGMLAAVAILLLFLGTVLQMNTLFFACGASFCVGIAIREWGTSYGAAFLAATTMLSFWMIPKKLDVFLFAMCGLYLVLSELLWNWMPNRRWAVWVGRYILFNCMYIPALFFVPQLFLTRKLEGVLWIVLLVGGQVGLFLFEKAHDYFQLYIWNRLRRYVVR